jgi:hypothetical protein
VFQWLAELIGGVFSARWAHSRVRRTVERSRSPWRKRARFSDEVFLPEPLDAAHARVARVLATIGTLREASEVGAFEAVTDATARSTGTVVHVQLVGSGDGTRVEVAAWPGAQLFDWGASRRAVERVIEGLGPARPVERPQTGRLR